MRHDYKLRDGSRVIFEVEPGTGNIVIQPIGPRGGEKKPITIPFDVLQSAVGKTYNEAVKEMAIG